MPVITEKIDEILENKNLSRYKLSKIIDYKESTLNRIIRGEQSFSKNVKEKILPILEISEEEFESWIIADKYPKEILELAIETKKKFPYKRKSILTTNIDSILQTKGLSRTALSKLIGNSQSGLNRAITGKEPLSAKLMQKISTALEIPENEIQSWVIADKYPLKVLELAVNIK